MGILDGVANRVQYEMEYKAGNAISDKLAKGAGKVFNKGGADKGKCPKCKTDIKDSSLKFCPNCGQKLTLTCAKCNTAFPWGTKFCTQCGGALKE